jgi:hypothetical protein
MRMRASRQNVGAFRSERLDRMADKAETRVEATIAMAVSNRGSPFYSSCSCSAFVGSFRCEAFLLLFCCSQYKFQPYAATSMEK